MKIEDKEFHTGVSATEFSSKPTEFANAAEEFTKRQSKESKKDSQNKTSLKKKKLLMQTILASAVGVTILTAGGVEQNTPANIAYWDVSEDFISTLEELKVSVENEDYEELKRLFIDEQIESLIESEVQLHTQEEFAWCGYDGISAFLLEDEQTYDFDGMIFRVMLGDTRDDGFRDEYTQVYVGNFENGSINGEISHVWINSRPVYTQLFCYFTYYTMKKAQVEGSVLRTDYQAIFNRDGQHWEWKSYEGEVTQDGFIYFKGMITAKSAVLAGTDGVEPKSYEVYFNLDDNGCLIMDDHVGWAEECPGVIGWPENEHRLLLADEAELNGNICWHVNDIWNESYYYEGEALIFLDEVYDLPYILNCR